jgi:hypothetical protein
MDNCDTLWRGGRVVEGAALEMLFTRKGNEGSNPSLSVLMDVKLHKLIDRAKSEIPRPRSEKCEKYLVDLDC